MSTESVARETASRARKPGEASPPPTVDDRYARLLADDLGVKRTTIRTALIGEPVARALEVRAWVLEQAPDDPERRAKILLWWAKKRRAGAFRQDEDAERYFARKIAEYWLEHPDRLAETLREAMAKPGAA